MLRSRLVCQARTLTKQISEANAQNNLLKQQIEKNNKDYNNIVRFAAFSIFANVTMGFILYKAHSNIGIILYGRS
jgi:hypothetical protein